MRLIDAQTDRKVKVVRIDGSKSLLSKLIQHGLYPGDIVQVLREAPLGGPLLVSINGREVALGRRVAEKIIVEAE
jgi:ferrous iron transport protein A